MKGYKMIIDPLDQPSWRAAKLYCTQDGSFKVGLTSGCFDSLHYYHLTYLMRCAMVCDILLVGVDSDRKIRSEKGEDRPIVNERHRLAMVNALKCADMTFLVDSLEDIREMCNHVRPMFFFRNQEWLGKEEEVIIGDTNAQVIIVPDIEELTSTSDMIKRIQAQVKVKQQ
jgi:cytidyltransferase-like protein